MEPNLANGIPRRASAQRPRLASVNSQWERLQPPGALIRYLIGDWPPAKRTTLLQLLEVEEDNFGKLLVGAHPVSTKQAANLAQMTGIPEARFLEMEENFSRWCGIAAQTASPIAGNAGDVLFSASEISRRVASLALEMKKLVDKEVVLIGVLKGAFIFVADLIRALLRLNIDAAVGFIELKAYAGARVSKDAVKVVTDIDGHLIKEKTVLVVDDVHDTGKTLDCAVSLVKEHGAKETLTCVLVDKLSSSRSEQNPATLDYVGFQVREQGWLVGYGMDDKEALRGSCDILVRRD
jgi:hypoxanthine phosphoribosyltransferase